MTNRTALMTILGVVLTLAARVGLCTDSVASAGMQVRTPDSAAARAASELIARVQRALTGYFTACALRDGRALDAVTTSDVRFEYTLQDTGSYLSVDATSLQAVCPIEGAARVSELWIFPTNDPHAVFVRYTSGSVGGGTEQQLALVELRGERIARMLNFSTPPHRAPSADAAVTGRTAFDNHCRTCHSLREGDDRLGPSLHRVFGTQARLRSDSRIVWDEPTLDRFIADPDQVMSNDMKPYRGITDAAVRRSIVEFLKTNPDPWGE